MNIFYFLSVQFNSKVRYWNAITKANPSQLRFGFFLIDFKLILKMQNENEIKKNDNIKGSRYFHWMLLLIMCSVTCIFLFLFFSLLINWLTSECIECNAFRLQCNSFLKCTFFLSFCYCCLSTLHSTNDFRLKTEKKNYSQSFWIIN